MNVNFVGDTLINGKLAAWTQDIWEEFEKRIGPLMSEEEIVTRANYYTPRPYVDQYNIGSDKFGFTYTLNGHRVCKLSWRAP